VTVRSRHRTPKDLNLVPGFARQPGSSLRFVSFGL
jgi:hypothetical protein